MMESDNSLIEILAIVILYLIHHPPILIVFISLFSKWKSNSRRLLVLFILLAPIPHHVMLFLSSVVYWIDDDSLVFSSTSFMFKLFLTLGMVSAFPDSPAFAKIMMSQPVISSLISLLWRAPFEEKASPGVGILWDLDYTRSGSERSLTSWGSAFKQAMNCKNSRKIWDKMKMNPLGIMKLDSAETAGASKLRHLLDSIGYKTLRGSFADLCAGSCSFSKVMFERGASGGLAASFWGTIQSHENPLFTHEKLDMHEGDFRRVAPVCVDWILFDGGSSYPDAAKEESVNYNLLEVVDRWVNYNPSANYVIKVLCPWSDRTRRLLKTWQGITGKGKLVRLSIDRMSNCEMYFVSGPKADLDAPVNDLMQFLTSYWQAGEPFGTHFPQRGEPIWSDLPNLDAVQLEPLDMSDSRKEMFPQGLLPPVYITKFLKEVGYRFTSSKGSESGIRNSIIETLLTGLTDGVRGFKSWKFTSTTSQGTFGVVKDKVDCPPVENHEHWPRLTAIYKALGTYYEQKGQCLEELDDEELVKSMNRNGSLGVQEAQFFKENGITSLGEYLDRPELWKQREQLARQKLVEGKPILGIFSSMGKKEKKLDLTKAGKKGSRLVWFLPATMRILEARIFGNLEKILSVNPFMVSGLPLYDYGPRLYSHFKEGCNIITNDIAGWDTKVSHGLQRLEATFLMRLAKTKSHKRAIHNMYRLYSNAEVVVARKLTNRDEDVLYKVRGQVASGRRPTYVMNTNTNTVVQMAAASYSLNIGLDKVEEWALETLHANHSDPQGSDDIRGCISGDDSALFFGERQGNLFSKHAHEFLNAIGMERKNMALHEDSIILRRMEDVEFCSNYYTKVNYYDPNGESEARWMPVRPLSEIFAKAALQKVSTNDEAFVRGWAREQGLNMLVNYHHLPMAKAMGLAILSATPRGSVLQGKGVNSYMIQSRPWLKDTDDISGIVAKCLTRHSSYPLRVGVNSIRGLGYISSAERPRFENVDQTRRRKWYHDLPRLVDSVRQHKAGLEYEAWLLHAGLKGGLKYAKKHLGSVTPDYRLASFLPSVDLSKHFNLQTTHMNDGEYRSHFFSAVITQAGKGLVGKEI